MAKENVPNPVKESRPTKTRVPMPAARSPGTRTRPSIGPPSPTASMRRNAPAMGEPKSVLIAAKLPAAAMTVIAVGGASRRARRTAMTPRIPPMAMSGASGPRTMPRLSVARAATITPGRSIGSGVPPAWNPSAGEWPAVPGQILDGQADQQTGDGHQRERPPHRLPVEPEPVGNRAEEPPLHEADQLEEAVRNGGDRRPDECRHRQQGEVARRSDQSGWVGRTCCVGRGGRRRISSGRGWPRAVWCQAHRRSIAGARLAPNSWRPSRRSVGRVIGDGVAIFVHTAPASESRVGTGDLPWLDLRLVDLRAFRAGGVGIRTHRGS